jgi:hypothetical protein
MEQRKQCRRRQQRQPPPEERKRRQSVFQRDWTAELIDPARTISSVILISKVVTARIARF